MPTGPRRFSRYCSLVTPMPCSPVIVPPRASAASKMRSNARCTRATWSGSRSSMQQVGCRLPSPACPKTAIRRPSSSAMRCTSRTIAGELGARHRRVLQDERRREARERGDRAPARGQQLAGRVLVGRHLDADARPPRGRSRPSSAVSRSTTEAAPSWPKMSIAPASVGQAEAGALVDHAHRRLVEELERGGQDAVLDDAADRARRGLEVAEVGGAGRLGLGRGQQLERDLGQHGERPLGADQQTHEVVAGDVLGQLAAHAQHAPAHEHGLEADHVVARDAVLEPAQAARALHHVAADRRDHLRARIGRVEQALRGHGLLQQGVLQTRLAGRREVLLVDLDQLAHAGARQHDAAAAAAPRRPRGSCPRRAA